MEKFKIYFFGYGGHSPRAERLRPLINGLGMELITIHEGFHDIKPDIPWDTKTYISELKKADIIILPQDIKTWPAKSCNKLTQALSLGKPVICSSQDSYKAVDEKYPGCCIFADSDEEWKSSLERLRDDSNLRQELSKRALEAAKGYSIDVIGNKWLDVLKNRDRCDIVIPTYNNLPCLKLCIESIRECTEYPHNVIVVNNGPDEAVHEYLQQQKDIKYIKTGRMTFSQAVNTGIKAGKEKHVLILNDDVIVSRGWLTELIRVTQPDIGAVGVLSNCDKGWLHNHDINIGGVELLPGINTLGQIEPIISQIYEYKSPWADIVERDWVAFYCTLIPRKVINEVGILNERYINSGEDVDLCRRIRNKGYKIVQNYNSFVFHFGAVGRKILEAENKESYQENDRRTQSILREIWDKKTVVIYTGPAWERWDFRNLDNRGIAGSETWAIQMARSFSKLGYRVIVFADCPESGLKDGEIEYLHYDQWSNWIEQHWIDYFISSRTTDTLKFPVRARKVYVLSHDIWLLSPREQLFMDKVDKFCVLSEWHRDFFSNHHGVPKDKIWITSNGLDFNRFNKKVDRDPYRLIWSSSWDRGLDNVLYLLPFIREKIPQINLHIFYGTLNWKESCKRKNDTAGLQKIENLEKQIREQPNVFEHGRVPQDQLAEEFLKSSLWLYPSAFSETFCCLPDNEIFTNNGFKKIIEVCLSDLVLTHKNRFKNISKLMSRPYEGIVYSLKVACQMYDTGFFTENHPILSMSARDVFIERGKKWKNFAIDTPVEIQWKAIKDLKVGDYVCMPHLSLKNNIEKEFDFLKEMKKININYKEIRGKIVCKDHPKYRGIRRYIKADMKFARFLGFYLAEGSCSQGVVSFSFNTEEERYIKFIEDYCCYLGTKTRREVKGNSTCIKITCHILTVWLTHMFGHSAYYKKIPVFLYSMNAEFISHFLISTIEGDGWIGNLETKIQLASKKAIKSLKMLMMSVGMYPSYTRPRQIPTKDGEERVYASINIANGQWQRFSSTTYNKKTQKSYFEYGGYIFFRIRRIENKNYKGLVYNMEIEEDNSYVSDFLAVHNCITSVEAQATGVPVLANNFAGLKTTISDSGILLGDGAERWPYTKEGREAFYAKTLELLTNKEEWQKWSQRGLENVKKYSWDEVAKRWQEQFKA